MQGFELKFNVYADSQEQADQAATEIKTFISELASKGIAVSASKLTSAIARWKNNPFVIQYFR